MRAARYVVLAAAVAAAALLAPTGAEAHGWHRGHVRFFTIGSLFWPHYQYGYGYYDVYATPTTTVPSPAYLPPPAPVPPASVSAPTATAAQAGPCREYTREVVIDGVVETAFGTACLQDGGSWRIVN